MTELKTLKDFEIRKYLSKDKFLKELKAEAIKWVKNGDRKLRQLIPSASNYKECVIGIKTTQETFKTFFNITEEDLVPIEKRELVPIK